MKIATITLFVEYPAGTPDTRMTLFDTELRKSFTEAVEDTWWGIDCGAMPTPMSVQACDMTVNSTNFSPNGPATVRTYDLGSGWSMIGSLHETTMGIRDLTIYGNPDWQVEVTDPHDGHKYTAPVRALYRIGSTKAFS